MVMPFKPIAWNLGNLYLMLRLLPSHWLIVSATRAMILTL